jgi:hypothetical protein
MFPGTVKFWCVLPIFIDRGIGPVKQDPISPNRTDLDADAAG